MRITRLIPAVLVTALVLAAGIVTAQSAEPETVGDSAPLVTLALKDAPVADAVALLFRSTGYDYRIDEGVTGRIVAMDIKGVPFDRALKALANAAKFEYAVEDGMYVISPGATPSEPAVAESADEPAPLDEEAAEEPNVDTGEEPGDGETEALPELTESLSEADALPEADNEAGVSETLLEGQDSIPVYYGQWDEPYPDYFAPRQPYNVGGVTVLPGISSEIVIGAEPTPRIVRYNYRAPKIPGYYSADIAKFREWQSAIRGRPVWQPSYNW